MEALVIRQVQTISHATALQVSLVLIASYRPICVLPILVKIMEHVLQMAALMPVLVKQTLAEITVSLVKFARQKVIRARIVLFVPEVLMAPIRAPVILDSKVDTVM